MADNSLRTLYVAQFFMNHRNEATSVNTTDIIEYLASKEMVVTRQTLYRDIDALNSVGFSIVRTSGGRKFYYDGSTFELAEVKLLIDIVQSSPFITQKKSLNLISKLSTLVSPSEAAELKRHVYIMNRPRAINENLYYTVDGINHAINENKMVTFYYFDYALDGSKKYRHDKHRYCVNPVSLCVDRFYYLVAYDEKKHEYRHYRLDRMEKLSISHHNRCEMPTNFDLGKYVKTIFSMYNGENETVQMRFHEKLLNSVIDRFGAETMMHPDGEEYFTVTTAVDIGPTFYGWLSQFGDMAQILAPESVRESYIEHVQSILSRYVK